MTTPDPPNQADCHEAGTTPCVPAYGSTRPVRRRLLVPLAAMLVVLLGVFALILLHSRREHMARSNKQILETASRELQDGLDEQANALAAIEEVLLRDDSLISALHARDRDRLLSVYEPLFETLRANHRITHFYFHRPDRVNLLRVHKPEKYGDLIDRFTAREAERTGRTASGIELGPLGTFTLRVVRPVFDGDALVGYLELGKEIEEILATLHREDTLELAVAVHKNVLDPSRWEAGMKMLNREAEWDRFAEDVLVYTSFARFPTEAEALIRKSDHSHADPILGISFEGKPWRVLVTPLTDVSGAEVGDLFVFRDTSTEAAQFNRLLGMGATTAIVVLATLFMTLYQLLGRADQEIRQRERYLEAAEQRASDALASTRALLAALPTPVFVKDVEGRYLDCNRAFTQIMGVNEEDVIGKTVHELWPREHAVRYHQADLELLQTGERQEYEFKIRTRDGEDRDVLFVKNIFRNGRGETAGIIGAYIDITGRKRAEQDLIEAREVAETAKARLQEINALLEVQTARAAEMASQAEAANAAKSEFLANMSHEIRTPMTAIKGFAEIMRDELSCCSVCPAHGSCEIRDRNLESIGIVCRNGDHLLQILNDILDISKIEAGQLTVEPVEVSVCELLNDVKCLMQVRADGKGLGLEVEYGGPVPETIRTDPVRLRQILVNLVGNAIKFTETGGVRLVVRYLPDGDTDARLQIDVVDTGIGMTTSQTDTLFRPFAQADTSTTRKYGGTGLGLTVSKRLAEALGGDVCLLSSEPGAGSVFRVSVSAGSADGVRMQQAPSIPGREAYEATRSENSDTGPLECRILLAEDGPDNRRLVTHVLRQAGAEIHDVDNGRLAVEAALAARDEGHPFDAILMDMQMPEMDGYEATGLLRRKGYTGIIIALTANAMATDRQKCIDAGCSDYISKPIKRSELIRTIRKHLHSVRAANA